MDELAHVIKKVIYGRGTSVIPLTQAEMILGEIQKTHTLVSNEDFKQMKHIHEDSVVITNKSYEDSQAKYNDALKELEHWRQEAKKWGDIARALTPKTENQIDQL